MRWQRAARGVVALIGLGCAVAIFAYGRARQRPAPVETPAVLTDPSISSQGSGALIVRTNLNKGGQKLKIEAKGTTNFTDGRVRYDQAHFTTTRANGTTFETWAGVVEAQGKAVTSDEPGIIYLTKSVRTKSDDGLEVVSDSATYDNIQGLATMPGPVTFTRGRLKGSGVGATYDRERDVLWLLDQAHVTRLPDDDGGGGLEATAQGIGLARPDRYMNLRGAARIVQPEQTLTADQIIVHFTEDERGASLLEMRGAARVTPSGARARATGPGGAGAPELQSDEITLEFQPDGQTLRHAMLVGKSRLAQAVDQGRQTISSETIDLVTGADGRTLTNLEAKIGVDVVLPPSAGAPDRTVHAESLVTSGDESGGLKSAIFDGGVRFVEKGTPPQARGRGAARPAAVNRQATATTLALALGGQLGVIQKAEFRQNVSFSDGDMKAGADIAIHDEVGGTLELWPAQGAKKAVWMEDSSVRVEGMWILVAMDTHDVRAKDQINVYINPARTAPGAAARSAALFDGAQRIYGKGAALKYISATGEAIFAGGTDIQTTVYQMDAKNPGQSPYLRATDRIELNQTTGDLTAVGQVNASFMFDTPPDAQSRGRSAGARSNVAPAKGAPASPAPAPAPTMTRLTGAELSYVDATRTLTMRGDAAKPADILGPDNNVVATQIVLTLEPGERVLKTLVASGAMTAKFDGGRETIGDQLVYNVSAKSHVITGKPMYFKNVQIENGKPSCSMETSTQLNYNDVDQTISEPGSTNRALRASTPIVCAQPLSASIIKK